MIAKYNIQYSVPFLRHDQPHHHITDDPIVCEEFLVELLERGFKITSILHDGVALSRKQFDEMIKAAIGVLMSRHLCRSLGIDSVEAHDRFGSTA